MQDESQSADGQLQLATWARNGSQQQTAPLGQGAPAWCDWECSGNTLAVMQEGVGIYLWDKLLTPSSASDEPATQPLRPTQQPNSWKKRS